MKKPCREGGRGRQLDLFFEKIKRYAVVMLFYSENSISFLTLRAGKGIGSDICKVSPVFSSIWAYIVGHCKQQNE